MLTASLNPNQDWYLNLYDEYIEEVEVLYILVLVPKPV